MAITLLCAIAPLALLTLAHDKAQTASASIASPSRLAQVPYFPHQGTTTRLFNVSTGELDVEIEGQFHTFSPNGNHILTYINNSDSEYALFDESGAKRLELETDSIMFTPDGQFLVTEDALFTANGERVGALPEGYSHLSPDGRTLIRMTDTVLHLITLDDLETIQIPGQFLDFGSGFNATGEAFILQQMDTLLCTLFKTSGQILAQLSDTCAGISPNGEFFGVMSGTLDQPYTQVYTFLGHEVAHVVGTFPIFSSDSQWLVTMGTWMVDTYRLGGSQLHNIATEETFEIRGDSVQFSASSQRFVTAEPDTTYLYDALGREIANVPGDFALFLPHSDTFLTYVPPDRDQSLDISGGETRLFDRNGQNLATLIGDPDYFDLALDAAGAAPFSSAFMGLKSTTITTASPDGQRLATRDPQTSYDFDGASESHNSYLYDASGTLLAELPGVFRTFSPTGAHLVTVRGDTVYLFDRSGVNIADFQGWFGRFSPDGDRVAIATDEEPSVYIY